MQIPEKCPRAKVKIQGIEFTVPEPFAEGHTCTAQEASVLNQILRENIRNNNADMVKKAKEAGDPDQKALQKSLDSYVTTYDFGIRRGGAGRGGDPVQKEAMEIARTKVMEALEKKGFAKKDIDPKEVTKLAREAIKKDARFLEQAKQIVAAREESALEIKLD